MNKKLFFKIIIISFTVSVLLSAAFTYFVAREPKIGGDFQLQHRDSVWKFSDEPKKLNLLYIGYMRCPDVCPLSLSAAGLAFRRLSEDHLKNIRLIFLSVDYENDQAHDVDDYVKKFYTDFVGLTGTEKQINDTVDLFKASYRVEKDEKSYLGYSISHTDRIYFLNSKGIMLDSISSARYPEEVIDMIKHYF